MTLACKSEVNRQRETALHDDLTQMRKAIDGYHAKHHHYPRSLQELVRDGELRMIPFDPITKSGDTWHFTLRENVRVDDFTSTSATAPAEIVDVHSGATGHDSKGQAWSDY